MQEWRHATRCYRAFRRGIACGLRRDLLDEAAFGCKLLARERLRAYARKLLVRLRRIFTYALYSVTPDLKMAIW